MSGPSSSSSYSSKSLQKRAHPAQWALYGPAVGYGLQQAMGGSPFAAHAALADWRGGVQADTAGAENRLGGQMARAGLSQESPIAMALNRGLEETGQTNLAASQGAYQKMMEDQKHQWFAPTMSALANWPPTETSGSSQMSGGK